MTEVTAANPPRYILAPYVPTPPEVVERMLDLAGVRNADTVYDLGCGDGRIAIAAARRGARGFGVDIEPHWVSEAKKNAAAAGVSDRVSFEVQDALTADLTPATVVMLYFVEWSTRMFDDKLAAELRPGARIVSHSFSMGDRPAERTEQWVDATGQSRTLRLWIAGKVGSEPIDESLSALTRPRSGALAFAERADLTLAGVIPLVGSTFSLALAEPWNLQLVLAEASPLSLQASPTGAFRAPFRLIFHGPAQPVHPQATLPLDHPKLGRVEIFLVPVGPDAQGMLYEAIFS
ncbi:MAG: methyltransferase domain-containing protein [Thermoanaerobaculia bacterium]